MEQEGQKALKHVHSSRPPAGRAEVHARTAGGLSGLWQGEHETVCTTAVAYSRSRVSALVGSECDLQTKAMYFQDTSKKQGGKTFYPHVPFFFFLNLN